MVPHPWLAVPLRSSARRSTRIAARDQRHAERPPISNSSTLGRSGLPGALRGAPRRLPLARSPAWQGPHGLRRLRRFAEWISTFTASGAGDFEARARSLEGDGRE